MKDYVEKEYILDMDLKQLQDLMERMGQQKFRAKQVFAWISRGVRGFDEMTDLPKTLREEMKLFTRVSSLNIISKFESKLDGTVKYLFKLPDGDAIESVLMEYKHGNTVCISSQVGCKMGCKFCASTHAGYVRNLTSGEMLEQVLAIQRDAGRHISNVVVMGIGEPFDNYDNLLGFLKKIHDPDGLNMGYRHLTVSTCGLVPEIRRFTSEDIPVNLSISLHAPNDNIRNGIMPIGRRYSIDKIIEACKIYTEVSGRRITFEYAMFEGVNDTTGCAVELGARLKGMLCHVNLIPANSVEGTGFRKSGRQRIDEFKRILEHSGIETTVRRELGSDINAACGQLRRVEMLKKV